MQLTSKVNYSSSADMNEIRTGEADLVVTSPPYPMIAMWDGVFSEWSDETAAALSMNNGYAAYEIMHRCLDTVWDECCRVLKPGGFACINIGDATRKTGEDFRLYPNHSRIQQKMLSLGFDSLPAVLWRKQTNAPNKFMGSGMLPSGAYVTLEHEYILIFRKGRKADYGEEDRRRRRRSAFFWEERNLWFSDQWELKGKMQAFRNNDHPGSLPEGLRQRSAAFPLELAHRLVNMYSMQEDLVVDPFLGTGTTLNACLFNGRRCIAYETEEGLKDIISAGADEAAEQQKEFTVARLQRHRDFIEDYRSRKGEPRYTNRHYSFPVVTAQEQDLVLPLLKSMEVLSGGLVCSYSN